jgi:hypothetical protein
VAWIRRAVVALTCLSSLTATQARATCRGVNEQARLAEEDYVAGRYRQVLNRLSPLLPCSDSIVAESSPLDALGGRRQLGGPSRAWRVLGASSCFLRDRARAQYAWHYLDDIDRTFLLYVCRRNLIELGPYGPPRRELIPDEVVGELLILHGHATLARERARRAGPSPKSWRTIGAASCVLGDRSTMQDMLDLLDENGRRGVEQLCRRGQVPQRAAVTRPDSLKGVPQRLGSGWGESEFKRGASWRFTLSIEDAASRVAHLVDWSSPDWQEQLQALAEQTRTAAFDRARATSSPSSRLATPPTWRRISAGSRR